jgi:hypothetical protein
VHAVAAWAAARGGGVAEWVAGATLAGLVGLALGGAIAWGVGRVAQLRGA